MTTTTITPTTLPGQLPQQQYGVDESGAVFVYSPSFGQWLPENDATRMARESRARGYRTPPAASTSWLDRNGRPNAFRGI